MSLLEQFVKEYFEVLDSQNLDEISEFSAFENSEFKDVVSAILQTKKLLKTHFLLEPNDEKILQNLPNSLNAPLKIAVAGQFSSGKSTFLNALLGQNLLPSGITPITSKVCEIMYGSNAYLQVFYKNGEVGVEQLDFLNSQRELVDEVSHFRLYAPLEILKSVTFLDTPGFNSQNEGDTQATKQVLQDVDGIIWLSLIDNVGKNSEKEILLSYIKKFASKSLCVLNQKDRLKNEDEILTSLNYAKSAFAGIFEDVVAISARLALIAKGLDSETSQSKAKNDEKIFENSNISAVLDFMHENILPKSKLSKRTKTARILREMSLKYAQKSHAVNLTLEKAKKYFLQFLEQTKNVDLTNLRADSKALYNEISSHYEKIAQNIFSYTAQENKTFFKTQKGAFGSKNVEFQKQVSIFKIEEFLTFIKREDCALLTESNRVFSQIKHFAQDFCSNLPRTDFQNLWQFLVLDSENLNKKFLFLSTLPNSNAQIFLDSEIYKININSALENCINKFHSQNNQIFSNLKDNLVNALSLCALQLEQKIQKGVQSYAQNPDKFPLYEPTLANIREILNHALNFQALEKRFFIDDIAALFLRQIGLDLSAAIEPILQNLDSVKSKNQAILELLRVNSVAIKGIAKV